MEINDPSLQLRPSDWMKHAGRHAPKSGVRHVHGGRGACVCRLHPGDGPVQQVDTVARAQRVSHVTLEKHFFKLITNQQFTKSTIFTKLRQREWTPGGVATPLTGVSSAETSEFTIKLNNFV